MRYTKKKSGKFRENRIIGKPRKVTKRFSLFFFSVFKNCINFLLGKVERKKGQALLCCCLQLCLEVRALGEIIYEIFNLFKIFAHFKREFSPSANEIQRRGRNFVSFCVCVLACLCDRQRSKTLHRENQRNFHYYCEARAREILNCSF